MFVNRMGMNAVLGIVMKGAAPPFGRQWIRAVNLKRLSPARWMVVADGVACPRRKDQRSCSVRRSRRML